MNGDHADLPYERADHFTKPLARFIQIEAISGLILLLAVGIALGLANSPMSAAYLALWDTPIGLQVGSLALTRSLQHWINDGLMTLFFFVVALELKRALVLGELRDPRATALPLAGAIGGMLVPMAVFSILMIGQPGAHGWGTVMATDTAFAVGCLTLFGTRIPPSLRLFLLSLAIFDDVGAMLVVAVGYGGPLNWTALGLAAVGLMALMATAWLGIRNFLFYFLFGGVIWLFFDASGVHATVVGVILGLMTPAVVWVDDVRLRRNLVRVLSYPAGEHWSGKGQVRGDLRRAGRAVTEALSPIERLEMMLHPWVGLVIMPIFALANAGVVITYEDLGHPVSAAIFAGLVIGKPLGVLIFSWLSLRLGARRAPDLSWSFLIAGAFLTGIGFTMSLFIAGLAFDANLLNVAKIGILIASVFSASIGLAILLLTVIRRPRINGVKDERSTPGN